MTATPRLRISAGGSLPPALPHGPTLGLPARLPLARHDYGSASCQRTTCVKHFAPVTPGKYRLRGQAKAPFSNAPEDLHQQASLARLDALRQRLRCVRRFDGHLALRDQRPRIVFLGDDMH